MEEGFGELRADVRHIRTEATDIKADVRTTNVRMDELRKEMNMNNQLIRNEFGKKLDDLSHGMTEGQKEAATRIDKTREVLTGKIDETVERIERVQVRMDSAQKELAEKIDGVKDSLGQAKEWALRLYIGLAATLLLVIAHGFKWL